MKTFIYGWLPYISINQSIDQSIFISGNELIEQTVKKEKKT